MAWPPDAPVPWQERLLQFSADFGRLRFTRQELPGLSRYAEPALTGAGFRFSACHPRRPAPSLKIAHLTTGVTLFCAQRSLRKIRKRPESMTYKISTI